MPFTYTFSNGVVMTGWDAVVLTNQPPAERRAAYTARWGTPNACPPQGVGCREELLRRYCWPHKQNGDVRQGTKAKCYSCFRSNAPMPKGAASECSIVYHTEFLVTNELLDVPVGMDDEDLLPCGCEWKLAAVELFIKHRVNCLCQYDHQGNVLSLPHAPSTLNTAHRTVIWETLEYLQGGNLTVLDVVSGTRRIAATQAALANGAQI